MQGDDIGHAQQLGQRADLLRVTQRQLGHHIIEVHLHAEVFRQHRQLGADGAVTDDAQLLAADLEGVGGALQPATAVGNRVLLGNAAQQQDGLGQHQLGHRAGVGVRCVEDRDTHFPGGFQVNLVGTDTEATDGYQLVCVCQHVRGQLGAGAQTDEMGIGDRFLELFFREGAGVIIDIGVTGCLQSVDGSLVHTLEEQKFDLAFVQRGFSHVSVTRNADV